MDLYNRKRQFDRALESIAESKEILKENIKNLKKYGKIKITNSINKEKRAIEFKKFILKEIKFRHT